MKIFKGQRFFVYGGGISGKSACRAIRKRGGKAAIYRDGANGFVTPPEADYRAAIISPGIKPSHDVYAYCRDRRIEVMGEAELGFRLADCPIVGVTGTNGKTTVTMLIAAMIGGTACGNIGYPITTAVDVEHKALVCELSSFQLRDAKITPRVAVITNISVDHVDWHGSAEEYRRCKCNIASGMSDGYLVIGDDVTVGALSGLSTGAQIVRCSVSRAVDGAYIEDGYFKFYGERVCPTEYLRLCGTHNLKNALCAIAASKCMGADNSDILKAMASAESAPHRIQYVGTACGKRWIDDSKATNVSSCLAALDAVGESDVCLIVGGRDKDLDFGELFEALPDSVGEVIAMGESAQKMRDAAKASDCRAKFTVVSGLADAVNAAAKSDSKTVLLSPACASFDEFSDYAERGERFKAAVAALKAAK